MSSQNPRRKLSLGGIRGRPGTWLTGAAGAPFEPPVELDSGDEGDGVGEQEVVVRPTATRMKGGDASLMNESNARN